MNLVRCRRFVSGLCLGAMLLASGVASADLTIPFEHTIPVPGRRAHLLFSIWDHETGGHKLWQELHRNVTLNQGHFEVVLGAETPFGALFMDYHDLWIEIALVTRHGEPRALPPRVPLSGTAFAFHAFEADHAAKADHAAFADRAAEADHADHAGEADHATTADTAAHAETAASAEHAASADTADHADTAGSADHATTADSAGTADHATTADSADHAETAGSADHATVADRADTARHADTAASADHAGTADTAGHATSADSAESADYATTAGDADTLDGYHAEDLLANAPPSRHVPNHGLRHGQPVFFDGYNWMPAQAHDAATVGVGLADVVDADHFRVVTYGNFDGLQGLVPGFYYYVSATCPGALTTQEPARGYSNPILLATSQTEGVVLPYRPLPVAPFGVFEEWQEDAFTLWPQNTIGVEVFSFDPPSPGRYYVTITAHLTFGLESHTDRDDACYGLHAKISGPAFDANSWEAIPTSGPYGPQELTIFPWWYVCQFHGSVVVTTSENHPTISIKLAHFRYKAHGKWLDLHVTYQKF